jgi:hypothetical protein
MEFFSRHSSDLLLIIVYNIRIVYDLEIQDSARSIQVVVP